MKWININDKLPKFNERVLVVSQRKNKISIGVDSIDKSYYNDVKKYEPIEARECFRIYRRVTHWMPLPEFTEGL